MTNSYSATRKANLPKITSDGKKNVKFVFRNPENPNRKNCLGRQKKNVKFVFCKFDIQFDMFSD